MGTEPDISAVIERHFPGVQLRSIERLTGGVSADAFCIDLAEVSSAGARVVLRVHGPTHGGHGAALEHQLLQALHGAGLPVPMPLGFDESTKDIGHPYVLLAFVEGSTAIPDERVNECITAMARCLSVVHDTPTGSLPHLPLRLDPVPELLEALPGGADWRDFKSYLLRLGNRAFAGTPVLLHGDFWPENVIWREGRIAAVLDWEDAALGDPLSDLACTSLELSYLYGPAGAQRVRAAYGEDHALNAQRLALWDAYVAATALRYMGTWRLEPSREAHMRRTALASLRKSALMLAA